MNCHGAAAGDPYRGGKAEQSSIPALGTGVGRVMVNQGQTVFIWILPWLEKREPDAVPVNQSLHRRQRKAGSVCSACGVHRAPEPCTSKAGCPEGSDPV